MIENPDFMKNDEIGTGELSQGLRLAEQPLALDLAISNDRAESDQRLRRPASAGRADDRAQAPKRRARGGVVIAASFRSNGTACRARRSPS